MGTMDDVAGSNVRLKSGINLDELVSGNGTTFEIDMDDLKASAETPFSAEDPELYKFANLDCFGLDDEDTYNEEPFEQLAKRMTDLTADGKVQKRVLREGVGETIPGDGCVTCDYNAFVEYQAEPFDSTFAFHRPFRFQLGSGKVLVGLEIAVQSMRVNEKSQFLVHPDLAYGSLGCLDRIPPNATILFEVELKNCINVGAAEKFSEDDEQTFENVYAYAEALRVKGNDLYKRNLFRQAIKEYNIAVSKLQNCHLKDYADQEKQQALLLRLYTNLVVIYTKKSVPRKACIAANNIYYLVKGTSLKIPAKVYFNNARSLVMLGNLSEAEMRLKQAHRLEPHSNEIADEFINLDGLKRVSLEREKRIAKAFVNNGIDKTVLSDDFKKKIDGTLTDLVNDPDCKQSRLPDDMTKDEVAFARAMISDRKLHFRQDGSRFYASKSASAS